MNETIALEIPPGDSIHAMRRFTLQMLLLVLLASLCLGGYLTARHILKLPFRPTNDSLHQRGSAFTLDFLIPVGTYLDEKITIGEVIQIRFKKEKSIYERVLRVISDLIPPRYRLLADLLLFCFWFFCFMTLIRVFMALNHYHRVILRVSYHTLRENDIGLLNSNKHFCRWGISRCISRSC